ncbi:MAG TPA: hypothetical protein VJN92_11515 [Candidatus Acidoferrum sp.]|nr:hypothetical protein [Candidatus Acidoferrum sp.]
MYPKVMASGRQSKANLAAERAQQLHEALLRERVVPRFVDTYVLENSRQALQVHAVMYRDLLALLQREALLELSVRALEIICDEPRAHGRSKPHPMPRREAALFRKKFLAALVRQQGWNMGEALDFQRDFQLYEDLLSRTPRTRRSRKPFEAANHPYVDRCAFLLDSSFLEQARVAASRALTELENLATQVCEPEKSENNPALKN